MVAALPMENICLYILFTKGRTCTLHGLKVVQQELHIIQASQVGWKRKISYHGLKKGLPATANILQTQVLREHLKTLVKQVEVLRIELNKINQSDFDDPIS